MDNKVLDRCAFWILKAMTVIFLISAIVSLLSLIVYSQEREKSLMLIPLASLLTSLFFAATSHVLSRVIERIYATATADEEEYVEIDESSAE